MASRYVADRAVTQRFALEVARRLAVGTGNRIEGASKRAAPVRKPNENGRLGGRLRSSIGIKVTQTTTRVTVRIGSRLKYAEVAHQGAKRHKIYPKRKQFLSFKWNKAARYGIPVTRRGKVQFKSVNHPGMKGTKYLTKPFRRIARQDGFRITYLAK